MFFRKRFLNIKDILAENKLAVILILIGAFLRLYRFGDFVTYLGDQGRDAIIIERILTLQHFPAIGAPSSVGQIFLGPFYYYLISPFLLLFNFNPIGLAYGVFFLSMIGLISAYFILKHEFNTKTALFFLIFVIFSSINIDLARYSWNPNLLPGFAFFTFYFFYKLIKTNKKIYAFLFGSFLSFSIQLHYLAVFLFLPILFYIIKSIILKVDSGQDLRIGGQARVTIHLNKLLITLFSFLFFSLPLIIFDLRHNFLNIRGIFKMFQEEAVISKTSLFTRILETNQAFLNFIFRLNLNQIISLFIILFLIIYVFFFLKKTHWFVKLNFWVLILFIFIFSFLESQRLPHYYGTVYYGFFLVLSYSLSRIKNLRMNLIIIPLFFILYIGLNARNYYFFFNKPNRQIEIARNIASSITNNLTSKTFQTVSLPYYETDGHVRYFLELSKNKPLPADTLVQPDELYVLCFEKSCQVLGNPQWQTASFKNGKIDKIWTVEGVKIYKVVHNDK